MDSWTELAGRFADKKCFHSLDPGILSQIESLPLENPVLVACSGGADSVFLVLALASALTGREQALHVLHFNHGVRGEESDKDEAFVRDLAEGLSLTFLAGKAESTVEHTEAALRAARYDWMVEVYHSLNAGCLCLGQHADDVAESVLMAVLTGAGPAGLSSPPLVKKFPDGHIRMRPMLEIRRSAVLNALKDAGVPWREDQSNNDPCYTRNRMRHEVLPLLEKTIPQDVISGLVRTHGLMGELVDALDAIVEEMELDMSVPGSLCVQSLRGRERAIIRRALMAWWLRHHSEQILSKGALDTLVELISTARGGGSVAINDQEILVLGAKSMLSLNVISESQQADWAHDCTWSWQSGPVYLPCGAQLAASVVNFTDIDPKPFLRADPSREAWISLQSDSRTLTVRQWVAGDRYHYLGSPGSRKLQDIFSDAKLSYERKRLLPVLTNRDGMILWVPGFPPAEAVRINPDCKSALKLTYSPQ